MDKKQPKKDKTFEAPSDEIQAKITELMGLPADKAEPTLSKYTPISNGRKNNASNTAKSQIDHNTKEDDQKHAINDVSVENIESEATDRVVDDIIHDESDKILDQSENKPSNLKVNNKSKHNNIFTKLWRNKKFRYLFLLFLFTTMMIAAIIPNSRYAVLNAVGVKATTSFSVIDQISGRPVKNMNVEIAGQKLKTEEDGSVKVNNLKLGATRLILSKRSFETVEKTITIGWGSNPFQAPFEVLPTGTTFSFTVADWLDGELIKDAEVTDGESIGIANDKGIANLTIEPTDEDITITVSAAGYLAKEVIIPADSVDSQDVSLVPSKPDIFLSKRSGKYDVYKRYLDGDNEEIILPGTGSEQDDTHVLGHPTDHNIAALVSSRAGNRNQDGYLLSDIYMIDIDAKTAEKIESTQSERIRIIGWHGDSLVFVKTIAGPSASFANRQRIVSYEYGTKTQLEIASANYFSDVRLINNQIVYVISSSAQDNQGTGLVISTVDGENKKVIIGGNIWGVYRTSNETLVVSSEGENWYKYDITSDRLTSLVGAPAEIQNKSFVTSPGGDKTALVETIDGQTELIIAEGSKTEKVVRKPGISSPIYWVNDKTIVFGVNNSQESARYVVGLNNKEIRKIGDNLSSVYSGVPYF